MPNFFHTHHGSRFLHGSFTSKQHHNEFYRKALCGNKKRNLMSASFHQTFHSSRKETELSEITLKQNFSLLKWLNKATMPQEVFSIQHMHWQSASIDCTNLKCHCKLWCADCVADDQHQMLHKVDNWAAIQWFNALLGPPAAQALLWEQCIDVAKDSVKLQFDASTVAQSLFRGSGWNTAHRCWTILSIASSTSRLVAANNEALCAIRPGDTVMKTCTSCSEIYGILRLQRKHTFFTTVGPYTSSRVVLLFVLAISTIIA